MGIILPIDIAILRFINITIANPAFDFFFGYIGDFKIWRWPLLIFLGLILWKGGGRGRWMVLLCIITAAITDPSIHYIFKPLIGRLRPCQEPALDWLRLLDGCGGKYGFPSSHAANFFGQAVIIGSFYRITRYYIYPIAVLVALSRVYLGVHYPTDILAGAFLGIISGLFVIYVSNQLAPATFARYYRPRHY